MPYNVSFLKSAWIHDCWHKLTFPDLVGRVKEHGFDKVDVLYFRTAKQLFWLDAIDHELSVFRVADNDSGFFDYNDEVQKREQALIRKADLTVYTSRSLESYLVGRGAREKLFLPNGVDFSFFSRPAEKPSEYDRLSGPIALHVGSVLPELFDFALVDMLTERFPEVQFVFVGPDEELRRRIQLRPNVHLLGSRTLEQVRGYMQHADVGLILFDPVKNPTLVNSINPIKLYQYLVCGLPVVSREWDTLVELAPPILMTKNREEFCHEFKSALSADKFTKDELRLYAKRFDWKTQFDLFLNRIESFFSKKSVESRSMPDLKKSQG